VKAAVNSNKRDKIPASHFLQKRKDTIINYWEQIAEAFTDSFEREVIISLTGSSIGKKTGSYRHSLPCRKNQITWSIKEALNPGNTIRHDQPEKQLLSPNR
jgi:hypothetical protein